MTGRTLDSAHAHVPRHLGRRVVLPVAKCGTEMRLLHFPNQTFRAYYTLCTVYGLARARTSQAALQNALSTRGNGHAHLESSSLSASR